VLSWIDTGRKAYVQCVVRSGQRDTFLLAASFLVTTWLGEQVTHHLTVGS
jgi:hypothetical protein